MSAADQRKLEIERKKLLITQRRIETDARVQSLFREVEEIVREVDISAEPTIREESPAPPRGAHAENLLDPKSSSTSDPRIASLLSVDSEHSNVQTGSTEEIAKLRRRSKHVDKTRTPEEELEIEQRKLKLEQRKLELERKKQMLAEMKTQRGLDTDARVQNLLRAPNENGHAQNGASHRQMLSLQQVEELLRQVGISAEPTIREGPPAPPENHLEYP